MTRCCNVITHRYGQNASPLAAGLCAGRGVEPELEALGVQPVDQAREARGKPVWIPGGAQTTGWGLEAVCAFGLAIWWGLRAVRAFELTIWGGLRAVSSFPVSHLKQAIFDLDLLKHSFFAALVKEGLPAQGPRGLIPLPVGPAVIEVDILVAHLQQLHIWGRPGASEAKGGHALMACSRTPLSIIACATPLTSSSLHLSVKHAPWVHHLSEGAAAKVSASAQANRFSSTVHSTHVFQPMGGRWLTPLSYARQRCWVRKQAHTTTRTLRLGMRAMAPLIRRQGTF
jgi:hypothetical protein